MGIADKVYDYSQLDHTGAAQRLLDRAMLNEQDSVKVILRALDIHYNEPNWGNNSGPVQRDILISTALALCEFGF